MFVFDVNTSRVTHRHNLLIVRGQVITGTRYKEITHIYHIIQVHLDIDIDQLTADVFSSYCCIEYAKKKNNGGTS